MPVNSTHPEYNEYVCKWELVRDVVRSNVKKYIKNVETGEIKDKAIDKRNERYRDDARFTNFTARTKNGLVGAVFRKDIQMDLPESINYLEKDATGCKMGLKKLTQEVTGEVLQSGRYGLLVDYPASEDGLTAAQVAELNLKARFCKYPAESIINWQYTIINGQCVLSLVVLQECVASIGDDGFSWVSSIQYRELRLENNVYIQRLYNDKHEIVNEYVPRGFNGSSWNFIPFAFVGSEDNDAKVDPSPLYDLAELNIGHLRNSADYEESVHVTGQPTLFLSSEMTMEQFQEFNPNGVQIGARRGHNLGAGGNAIMLQASPNQLADEAMRRKEEQAVMIGARLVQAAASNETAEAARIKHSGENSVLAAIVDNVEAAILQCLEWCLIFSTNDYNMDDVVFEINKTFFDITADANLIMAQIQLFNNGIIAQKDIRDNLRKTGVIEADRTDDDIDAEASVSPLLGGMINAQTEETF